MKRLQARDTARLASAQQDAMNDLCTIYHVTYITGAYSDDQTQVLTGTFNVACGFHMLNGSFINRGQVVLIEYDALMRLPASQIIHLDDRFVLTEKGNTLISGTFTVYGHPVINSSVQHVQLKRDIS